MQLPYCDRRALQIAICIRGRFIKVTAYSAVRFTLNAIRILQVSRDSLISGQKGGEEEESGSCCCSSRPLTASAAEPWPHHGEMGSRGYIGRK